MGTTRAIFAIAQLLVTKDDIYYLLVICYLLISRTSTYMYIEALAAQGCKHLQLPA